MKIQDLKNDIELLKNDIEDIEDKYKPLEIDESTSIQTLNNRIKELKTEIDKYKIKANKIFELRELEYDLEELIKDSSREMGINYR